MKRFERLVLSRIETVIPPDLDRQRFAHRTDRSTEDAITTALHLALTHLEKPKHLLYVRMLFVDSGSAFTTVIPHELVTTLSILWPWFLLVLVG